MFKFDPQEFSNFKKEEERKQRQKDGTNDDLNVVSQASARQGSALQTPGQASSKATGKKASPNKTVGKKGKKSTSKGKKEKKEDPMAKVKSQTYEVSVR